MVSIPPEGRVECHSVTYLRVNNGFECAWERSLEWVSHYIQ
jgi:hypothetical protein